MNLVKVVRDGFGRTGLFISAVMLLAACAPTYQQSTSLALNAPPEGSHESCGAISATVRNAKAPSHIKRFVLH